VNREPPVSRTIRLRVLGVCARSGMVLGIDAGARAVRRLTNPHVVAVCATREVLDRVW